MPGGPGSGKTWRCVSALRLASASTRRIASLTHARSVDIVDVFFAPRTLQPVRHVFGSPPGRPRQVVAQVAQQVDRRQGREEHREHSRPHDVATGPRQEPAGHQPDQTEGTDEQAEPGHGIEDEASHAPTVTLSALTLVAEVPGARER